MRILEPFVLAAALVAAPAAAAEPICDAIKHAAKVGASDNHFNAFRRDMPAPEGFVCRINFESGLGAYACSTPVEPEARVARAKALIEAIRTCFRSSPVRGDAPREGKAVFRIARSPKSWVIVNGADVLDAEDKTRVYMNVVVATVAPPGAGYVNAPESDPYSAYHPSDPGMEVPYGAKVP